MQFLLSFFRSLLERDETRTETSHFVIPWIPSLRVLARGQTKNHSIQNERKKFLRFQFTMRKTMNGYAAKRNTARRVWSRSYTFENAVLKMPKSGTILEGRLTFDTLFHVTITIFGNLSGAFTSKRGVEHSNRETWVLQNL